MMADNQLLNDNNNDGVGGGDDIFVYTGGDQEVPRDVKRVRIAENVDTIPRLVFSQCEELIEVKGHKKMKKIEEGAFNNCPSLRRVTKMPGVIEIEACAFNRCFALSELEFDKLEIIGSSAFLNCKCLRSIHMPSIRRVCYGAFVHCAALTDVVFGQDLERIEGYALAMQITRIAIPLKDDLIIRNNAFDYCNDLSRVDTLAGEIHKTISSLHMEQWRNEMQDEIDRINQTLPNIRFGKSEAIQQWITSVLSRLDHCRSEHQIILKEAMTLLELVLWKANLHDDAAATQDGGVRVTRGQRKRARKDRCITSGANIVIKNVLPFLTLK